MTPTPFGNDSANAMLSRCTAESQLAQWRHLYRSASDALRDLECPDVFHIRAKTGRAAQTLSALRDQYIKAGRPEIAWPESQCRKGVEGSFVLEPECL